MCGNSFHKKYTAKIADDIATYIEMGINVIIIINDTILLFSVLFIVLYYILFFNRCKSFFS